MSIEEMTEQLMVRIQNFFTSRRLKARVFRGGFWLGIGSSFEYGLRFLRNIILARILAPEDFGLMAIILAVNTALEAFTQIGVKEAVIQSPFGEEKTYLNGAWWLSFIRSLGLCAVAMISVPCLSSFYNVPENTAIFRISFLAIIFNGAISAGSHIVQKKMDYMKWAVITSGGGAIGVIITIGLSVWWPSVWALVIGYVIEAAARCLLSFIVCPFLPRLHFKQDHSKALLTYARGMFGLPILFFIFTQADIFVVGKLLQKSELGFYSMALALSQIPLYLVTTIINPIIMASFSEKQHDKDWINRTLNQSTRIITFIGAPVACFAALYARDLLSTVYGPAYASVALPFAVLLGSAILRAAGTPTSNVYFALGHPELQRFFTGIRAVIILILIYPAVKLFGLIGAASASFFSMLIGYIFQVVRIKHITNLDVRQYSLIFLYSIVISTPVFIIWLATSYIFLSPLHSLLLGLSLCVTVYGILSVLALRFKTRIDNNASNARVQA